MKNRIYSMETEHYSLLAKLLAFAASILLALVVTSPVKAQVGLYNNGGLLHTDKDAILYIDGNLENADTAKIENDGVIELTGDLTNNNSARMVNGADNSSTERAYKFTGSGTQTIVGDLTDVANRYIYNLIVDKQSSGSYLQLETGTFVNGSLIFGSGTSADTYTPTSNSTLSNNSGNGIIKTYDGANNDYELFITNPDENSIAGYAPLTIDGNPANGYIENRGAQGVGNGGLSRNVANIGAAYVFPVGSADNGYNAAALTFSALGATPDKIRNMFVDAAGGIGTIGRSCVGCGTLSADNDGFNYYFNANPCNGNAPEWIILDALPDDHGYWSFSGNSADQYIIETYPNSFSGFATASSDNWRMIKKTGAISGIPTGDWNPQITSSISDTADLLAYTKNTGCYSGNGIPGGVYTGFSHFQIAGTMTNNALPVELLYITAHAVDNNWISVDWATGIEINNSGFEVLRSTNGTDFTEIGWVENKTGGNSTVETPYNFKDNTAQPNVVYYYRLKQTDFDGHFEHSRIVQASLTGAESISASEFFPNPANESTSLVINSQGGVDFAIELYNMTGQLLLQNKLTTGKGNSQFNFSTAQLPQGNYRAVLKSNQQVFTRTLNIIK